MSHALTVTFEVSDDWPTPNNCLRIADALDAITPARYGDILRAYAHAEEARFDRHGPSAGSGDGMLASLVWDCVELAEAAHQQAGCPEGCGCTDCDLREAVYRLARHIEQSALATPSRDADDLATAMCSACSSPHMGGKWHDAERQGPCEAHEEVAAWLQGGYLVAPYIETREALAWWLLRDDRSTVDSIASAEALAGDLLGAIDVASPTWSEMEKE